MQLQLLGSLIIRLLVVTLLGAMVLINNAYADSQNEQVVTRLPYSELFLTVTLNHQAITGTYLFLSANNSLLIDQETLQDWRIQIPAVKPIKFADKWYYFLNNIHGLNYQVNYSNLSINIQAPASDFQSTTLDASRNYYSAATPPSPGGFFNYDIQPQVIEGQESASGIFQADIFNHFGVLDNNVVASQGVEDQQHFVRLNTTWTTDQPQYLRSFRLGDSFDDPGSWGQTVSFGGIQLATNFATQPSFVTLPLPTIRGQAALPSNVDLYINNALTSHQQVASGPFTITNIPAITGSGQINIVTTNLLGQQQVTTLPFYTSSELLKPGLSDYSYEAGFIRENYGIASNDYGPFMVTATNRVGITDNFTGEWHTEFLGTQQTAGLSGSWMVPLGALTGVWTNSVAASHDDHGIGALIATGYQHQGTHISFGASSEYDSVHFMQLGLQEGTLAPAWQNQAYVGFPLGYKSASINLSYIQQLNRSTNNVNLASASYSQSINKYLYMSLNGYTNVGGANSKAIYISFTWNINDTTYASASGTAQQDANQATVELTRNLPLGDGYGYDIQTTGGETPNQQASFSFQRNYGTYTIAAARQQDQTGYRFEASGGIVFLDGGAYLSRNIDNSFALVEVPGYKDINVYEDNQLIGQTNSRGNILLTSLRPYDNNPIAIDPNSLPLNAQLTNYQATVIPYYHAGNVVKFAAQQNNGGLITILLANGQPLPTNASVTIANDPNKSDYPVGEEGQIYLTGLEAHNTINIQWNGQTCEISLTFTPSSSPISNLGTYTCKNLY